MRGLHNTLVCHTLTHFQIKFFSLKISFQTWASCHLSTFPFLFFWNQLHTLVVVPVVIVAPTSIPHNSAASRKGQNPCLFVSSFGFMVSDPKNHKPLPYHNTMKVWSHYPLTRSISLVPKSMTKLWYARSKKLQEKDWIAPHHS